MMPVKFWITLLLCRLLLFVPAHASEPAPPPPAAEATRAPEFREGQKAPFLGVFTHLEPRLGFPEKLASLKNVLRANPDLAGITLKVQWRQLHPARETWDWAGLEALIATAAQAGKRVNLALIPGAAAPDWIFAAGAVRTTPVEFGRIAAPVPVPWDPKFIEFYLGDLRELARRYASDARVFQLEILGQNYNDSGEEMHAPASEAMKPYGWTRAVALQNWHFWIDRYAELFPRQKLSLVVSQMYRGGDEDLPGLVAQYFVQKLAGRGVLQTHQIQGREDLLAPSGQICRELARLAPNCHEMVQTFKERPDRQGSAAMTIYNARQMGDNLLYLQLWRRDAEDPKYLQALAEAWRRYGSVPLDQLKARMMADGVYTARAP